MKNWVKLEIDLLIMTTGEVQNLLTIVIRQQQWNQAAMIKDYLKHLDAIEEEL